MTSERNALVKFVANSIGAAGGLLVGSITFVMGAPWWSLPLCAVLGVVLGRLLPIGNSDADAPARLVSALRICRSLPLWDRIAMSALLVASATAVYIGFKHLDILTAFYLYLLPIVFAQLLFGTRCGFAAAFVSLVSIYYFVIPPKNSFAVQSCGRPASSAPLRCWRSSPRRRWRFSPTLLGPRGTNASPSNELIRPPRASCGRPPASRHGRRESR